MSKSGTKGRIGEQGPVQYLLNGWYPRHADDGVGPVRGRGEGKNDRGDIYGVPYTMIEAKNYSNPPVGSLLKNAEWKASNAGSPVWFLSYKRKGYSANRAGEWNALTTVEAFLSGFKPEFSEGDYGLLILEDVEQFVSEDCDAEFVVTARYPSNKVIENPWTLLVKFRPFYNPIEKKREEEFADVSLDDHVVTVVIHPRVNEPVEKWYAYTRISHMCRLLETVGILPQEDNQYDVQER